MNEQARAAQSWMSEQAWAPEIQPTGTLRAQFGEDVDDDVPF